jgi:hypothetical protein
VRLGEDAGHEVPTALLPSLLTTTLGAPASALGLIEGVADGLAGAARRGVGRWLMTRAGLEWIRAQPLPGGVRWPA